MYVCMCYGKTTKELRIAIDNGCDTMDKLQKEHQVATCCGSCYDCVQSLIDDA